MRVAHLTISHGPRDARVFHKECKALADAGHEVHLLVPGPVPPDSHGVRLHSLPEVGTATAYLWRVWRRLPSIYRRARDVEASVYHLPDPSLVPVGLLLKRRGARIVYDAHEDRPRQARTKYRALGRPLVGWISSYVWRALEWSARSSFDRFVAATPAIAKRFPAGRTTLISNFPRREEFVAAAGADPRPYRERANEVVYAGGLHAYLGIREAVQAMDLLPGALGARLVIMGGFERAHPGFREELERLPGWERAEYLGRVPRQAMIARLCRARVGLTVISPRPEHVEAIGGKTFEYMAAGLPVVASDFPVWRRIVRDERAGLLVDPSDPERIAAAVRRLLEHPAEAEAMGRRGAGAVAASYNWAAEEGKLVALYDELDPGPVGSRSPVAAPASLRSASDPAAALRDG